MQTARNARGLRFLPKVAFITTVVLISAAIGYQASAQQVYTEPVGFYSLQLLTNSDTFMSVPFERLPEFRGAVGSVNVATGVMTNSGSAAWGSGQWSTPSTPNHYYTYYMQMVSGNGAGGYFTIINNDTAGNLTVTNSFENLGSVSAGDLYQIIPFWTLNTVFPLGTGIVASTAVPPVFKTLVEFPNLVSKGKNLTPSPSYYYLNNGFRLLNGVAASNYNDVVVLPDQYVIIKQQNNAMTTTNVTLGQVTTTALHVPILANPSGVVGTPLVQWNSICIARPSVYNLDQTGLSNVVAASTAVPPVFKDEVLVFNNVAQAHNKTATNTYYFLNNHWRLLNGISSIDYGPTNIFNPGDGFIYQAYTNSTTLRIWSGKPNY